MKIIISEEVAEWYKREFEIENEAQLRFYVRYGGVGGHIPGFSLGVNLEPPTTIHTFTTVSGVMFYIEEADAWYFEDKDLVISLDDHMNEPKFTYQPI